MAAVITCRCSNPVIEAKSHMELKMTKKRFRFDVPLMLRLGSGRHRPFPAVMEQDPGLPTHTVYRPEGDCQPCVGRNSRSLRGEKEAARTMAPSIGTSWAKSPLTDF